MRRPFPRTEGLHFRSLPEARPAEISDAFRARCDGVADSLSMQPSFGSPLRLCSVRTEYLIVTTIASYDEQILRVFGSFRKQRLRIPKSRKMAPASPQTH